MKSNQKLEPKQPYDAMVKLLLIGNSGVGKSCILLQFAQNKYSTNTFTTIGVDHKIKYVRSDGKKVRLQIWDTAGQDRFKTITTSYYRGAHGIIIVYDITDRTSFQHVKTWLSEIQKNASDRVVKILVGNKNDLDNKREVKYQEGLAVADSLGISFFQTSAKQATNIENIFNTSVTCVLRNEESNKGETSKLRLRELDTKRKSGCSC